MSDVTRVITLGIGPAATIDGFILIGLNTMVITVSGSVAVTDAAPYEVSVTDGGVSQV